MENRGIKIFLALLYVAMCFGLIFVLSCALSGAVCWCFGLAWHLKTGLGTAIVWCALYLTLYIFFYGLEDEDEGD